MSAVYKTAEGAHLLRQRYRELLATWPVPNEQRHVSTREGETFVVSSGPQDAPPLILLPGSNSNSLSWRGDVAAWSDHFRVHAVDTTVELKPSAGHFVPNHTEAILEFLLRP